MTPELLKLQRHRFERWIMLHPCERPTDRFPTNPEGAALNGQYKDIAVQLAWESWCKAIEQDSKPTTKYEGVGG